MTATGTACRRTGTLSVVTAQIRSTLARVEVLTASALPTESTEKYLISRPFARTGLCDASYTADTVVGFGGLGPDREIRVRHARTSPVARR